MKYVTMMEYCGREMELEHASWEEMMERKQRNEII